MTTPGTPDSARPGSDEVEALRRIAATVNSNLELGTVLDAIVSAVSAFTEWKLCWVIALDVPAGVAEVIAREDRLTYSGSSRQRFWPIDEIPARDVVGGTEPIVIHDAHESGYRFYADDARRRGYRCGVLLPLREPDLDGRSLVLAVQRPRAGQVDGAALAFLEAVADLSSVALANAGKVAQEQRDIAELVRATAVLRTGLAGTLAGQDGERILTAVADALDVAIVVVNHQLAPMFTAVAGNWAPAGEGAADYVSLARNAARRRNGEASPAGRPGERDAPRKRAAPAGPGVSGKPGTGAGGKTPGAYGGSAAEGAETEEDAFTAQGLSGVRNPSGMRVKITELLPESERPLLACVLRRGPVSRVETALDSLVNVAVGIVVARSLLASAEQDRETDTALTELVRRSPVDPLALRIRLAALGLPPPMRCRIVRISARSPVDTDLRRVLSDVHGALRARRVSGVVVGWVDSSVVLVLPAHGDHHEALTEIRGMLRGVSGIGTTLTAVVSSPGPVPADGPRMWAECETLTMVGASGAAGDIVAYDGFGALAFLLTACHDGAAVRFVESQIGPLRRYDGDHSGSLVETLEVYLQTSARLQETARVLCIHVSTLRYRLDRITEILGTDLKNSEERFALALACRLMHMVDAAAGAAGNGGPVATAADSAKSSSETKEGKGEPDL
ncbi:helix-turn-helix domain-containing protein [Streptomyces sp. AM 4-1-1]|uniref:helix-turn-helix domain-containing protein n=1 Tax=Streptomyces sp. AM 4-1-1 TaxID=3028710 RepID=UPI0023BA3756|nr:helix-turn-helix domain-containing protein [Streptomyces sp. AM 4-1-1]WEH33131.1 helix-turn-helix domain-containing protein [Streptomyces sp. AM 4-1-1]